MADPTCALTRAPLSRLSSRRRSTAAARSRSRRSLRTIRRTADTWEVGAGAAAVVTDANAKAERAAGTNEGGRDGGGGATPPPLSTRAVSEDAVRLDGKFREASGSVRDISGGLREVVAR